MLEVYYIAISKKKFFFYKNGWIELFRNLRIMNITAVEKNQPSIAYYRTGSSDRKRDGQR